ncbi:MAG: ABC transporter permease [Acidobacteriota bacterium]
MSRSALSARPSIGPRHQLFLLRQLVVRDFRARYAGSLLGFFWSFVQPLWQLLLYTFVFSTVMKIPLTGARTEDFGSFLFCGLILWMAFQEGVQRSATAVVDNADLVTKLRFPARLLVVTVALTALLHAAVAAAVFALYLALKGALAWTALPQLLIALPLQIALTLGLGWLLCPLQVLFRDLAQVLGMVMTGWFYFTPIVYPLTLVPESYRPWLALNPIAPLVDLYRAAFLGGPPVALIELAPLAALAAALALGGWWLFGRLERTLADAL